MFVLLGGNDLIRTIIADNEVWVCQLIAGMVDWEELGFSVVGLAHDGVSLMEMIKEDTPDLVITDIQMPGMTGIEVAQYIKEQEMQTKVIIISGYNDFEYAKAAIDLGVAAYLLKPLEKEGLTNVLLQFAQNKQYIDQQEQEFFLLHQQLEQSQQQHFKMYLKTLLNDKKNNVPAITMINDQFSRSFEDGVFRVLLICPDPHTKVSEETDAKVRENIMSFFTTSMHTACYDLFGMEESIYNLELINYSAENEKLIISIFDDLLYAFAHNIPYISSYDITFGIGKPVSNISEIKDSYYSALNAIHARASMGLNQIIFGDQFSDWAVTLSENDKGQISSYINCYVKMKSDQLVHMLFEQYIDLDISAPPFAAYDIAKMIFDVAWEALPEKISMEYHIQHDYSRSISILEHAKNIEEIKGFLSFELNAMRSQCEQMEDKTRSIIDVVKIYVDDHLGEDIKLNDLANFVHMNSNYLCELFKKETGENFSKYLASKRINMAKTYLLDTQYRCNEVASMVGYNDIKYFNRVFKNYVGVTPKQYRKIFNSR